MEKKITKISQLDPDSIKYRHFSNISPVTVVATLQRFIREKESGRERERETSSEYRFRQTAESSKRCEKFQLRPIRMNEALMMSTDRRQNKYAWLEIRTNTNGWIARARGRIYGTQALPMPSCSNVVWTTVSSIVDDNVDDYGNNGIEWLPHFFVGIHSYFSIPLENDMWRSVCCENEERQQKKKETRRMVISANRNIRREDETKYTHKTNKATHSNFS